MTGALISAGVSRGYYTRQQVQNLFDRWNCAEPVPAKGKQVIVVWPKGSDLAEAARIEWSEHKSDVGDRLYSVVMGPADMLSQQAVQPAETERPRA